MMLQCCIHPAPGQKPRGCSVEWYHVMVNKIMAWEEQRLYHNTDVFFILFGFWVSAFSEVEYFNSDVCVKYLNRCKTCTWIFLTCRGLQGMSWFCSQRRRLWYRSGTLDRSTRFNFHVNFLWWAVANPPFFNKHFAEVSNFFIILAQLVQSETAVSFMSNLFSDVWIQPSLVLWQLTLATAVVKAFGTSFGFCHTVSNAVMNHWYCMPPHPCCHFSFPQFIELSFSTCWLGCALFPTLCCICNLLCISQFIEATPYWSHGFEAARIPRFSRTT